MAAKPTPESFGQELDAVTPPPCSFSPFSCELLMYFTCRTKSAFDAKMQKASKSTDLRVSMSVCTMFNVLMDAKKQCSKLCVLDTGQEVSHVTNHTAPVSG